MTFSRFACIAAAPLFLATTAMAQVFPTRAEGPVTDDAQLIGDASEEALSARLTALRAGGTAFDVVTLPNMGFYTMGADIAAYDDLLAENFGLGGENWALLLVFPEDRQFSLAHGPAFDARSAEVEAIVSEVIRPAFQSDNYDAGITAGVEAMIDRVIAPASAVTPAGTTPAPAAAAQTAEAPAESGGKGLYWLLGGLVVAVGGIAALVKRGNAKFAQQPCSACGKTGLTRRNVTLTEATLKTEGQGETQITCPSCGHVDRTPYTIAKLRPQGKAQSAETSGKTPAAALGVAGGAALGAAGHPVAPPVTGKGPQYGNSPAGQPGVVPPPVAGKSAQPPSQPAAPSSAQQVPPPVTGKGEAAGLKSAPAAKQAEPVKSGAMPPLPADAPDVVKTAPPKSAPAQDAPLNDAAQPVKAAPLKGEAVQDQAGNAPATATPVKGAPAVQPDPAAPDDDGTAPPTQGGGATASW